MEQNKKVGNMEIYIVVRATIGRKPLLYVKYNF